MEENLSSTNQENLVNTAVEEVVQPSQEERDRVVRRRNYIVLGGASVVAVAVVFQVVFLLQTFNKAVTQPPVRYDYEAQQRLLGIEDKKLPLSESDELAKKQLIAMVAPGDESGAVYRGETFNVDYLPSGDFFEVEILSTYLDQAKADASSWFISQGMSKEALCKMPVQFYINGDVSERLQGNQSLKFSPLAPGC